MYTKTISPQAVLALKDALSVIFWKKEDLLNFLKIVITNDLIIGTIDWNATKREAAKELIERMSNRLDIYSDDLFHLFSAVSDLDDFSHLTYWDEDGTKTKRAREAVLRVRNVSKGYFELTREKNEIQKRKIESEKKIIQNKSLSDELNILKERFNSLSIATDLQQRGFDFEKFLYDLFLLYELEPKGSFKIFGEQIDGAFTFQGSDYLLEAKWKSQVSRSDLASFCYKVETKFKTAVGLLITIGGVTSEAISTDFKSIIIMDGLDLITILDGRISLTDLLFKKRRKAIETGEIYVNFNQL